MTRRTLKPLFAALALGTLLSTPTAHATQIPKKVNYTFSSAGSNTPASDPFLFTLDKDSSVSFMAYMLDSGNHPVSAPSITLYNLTEGKTLTPNSGVSSTYYSQAFFGALASTNTSGTPIDYLLKVTSTSAGKLTLTTSFGAPYYPPLKPQDVTNVPEPQTWALALAGLAVAGMALRRKGN